MAIPYVNATLTAITPPGSSDDYDTPGSTGAARWTGASGVYIAEELIEDQTGDRVDELVQTRVEIPWPVGQLVKRGDTLTYEYEDQARQRVARNIIHAPIVGRVRVTLEDG